jgi:flagellar motor component MotA
MTVATVELVTAMQHLQAKAADAVIALVAFALLTGVWLAYFMVIPLDLRIH